MIEVVAALVPVFAIIALGAVLRRLAFMPEESWRAVERITDAARGQDASLHSA